MDDQTLDMYWNQIPVGKKNAVDYTALCCLWGKSERKVREILHELSVYDNGDNMILIRSSKTKGFYKSNDLDEIAAYRKECLNKGRSIFAPIKKCNRILNHDGLQFDMFNNLRVIREKNGLTQSFVCRKMSKYGTSFDCSLLSKMENGYCLPTLFQLSKLAEIYECEPSDLVRMESIYGESQMAR